MKFSTPLLTLVATSTVYSFGIVDVLDNYLIKRDTDTDIIDYRCHEEMAVVRDDYLCQKFYADPFSVIPSCRESPAFSGYFQHVIVDNLKEMFNLICQKDEAGNLCPYGEALLKEYSNTLKPISDKEREELKKKNTYKAYINFEKSREAFMEVYSSKNIDNPEDDSIYVGKQEAAYYMDTDECKAMSSDGNKSMNSNEIKATNTTENKIMNANAESGASTLNSGFFISLGLLLLSLSLY
ncbi:hypothetical protein PIROE2DRAFT_15106 [Piromyces sp. E2]|nr:hypothetical protein PIROE2DRAFT_15106 [Piromyces sp. E2]|eukprot:OUM59384.1 hypothetical protein PIROE2DRAFT_15106 [Piromyces sp. E2]